MGTFCLDLILISVSFSVLQGSEQMLSYVELCLDKQLSLMDCVNSTAHCDYGEPVQYPTIVHLKDLI